MPSFFSSKLVKERINEIDIKTQIIIIENSQNRDLKEELEKNHNNVKVIIPEKNLGWAKAINLGIKLIKTKFIFITQPDVKLINNCIGQLKTLVKEFQDFSILTPVDLNNKSYKNYELQDSEDYKNINKFMIKEVNHVDLTWLINRSKFNEKNLWDENIFLYFEAQDFAKRVKDKNDKIYIVKNINTYHIGSASHDYKYENYSILNRSWHYNWSRHYYNNKHFGAFYAYKKSFSLLFRLLLKLLSSFISFKFSKSKFVLVEIYGLLSSMIGLPSFYRPFSKIK